jgi:hypothetical protein
MTMAARRKRGGERCQKEVSGAHQALGSFNALHILKIARRMSAGNSYVVCDTRARVM